MTDTPAASPNNWLEDPEVQLMLRVKAGDAFAFEQLMERYHQRLVRFLRTVGTTDDSGEDLAQDVFLRVFRARESYQPNARFATWLFHIAHNVASNAIRDKQRRREIQLASASGSQSSILSLDQMAMASTGMMPVRRIDKAERAEMVQNAVDALNERQRMALMLCKFEGMSYQEIADTMELTVQAVKSLLSRARVNLKELLEPYVNEGQAMKPGGSVGTDDKLGSQAPTNADDKQRGKK
ncbi:MAG: RNA polymerase sigma factor [Pirellulales bacterium]